jgi:acetolactate synthase-1/2/3 large subunit
MRGRLSPRHQNERRAGDPVENKGIGQRLVDPDIDLAMMARSQGAIGIGPVKELNELGPAFEKALERVRRGKVCLVDVHVTAGYE